MRIEINLTKADLKNLRYIQRKDKKLKLAHVASEAMQFFFQIHYLLENGYKIAIKAPDGRMKYFGLNNDRIGPGEIPEGD